MNYVNIFDFLLFRTSFLEIVLGSLSTGTLSISSNESPALIVPGEWLSSPPKLDDFFNLFPLDSTLGVSGADINEKT